MSALDAEASLADVDPETFEWPDDAPPAHRLVTAGVASMVWAADRSLLGHVVMLDLDDTGRADALAEAERLADPAVVLRSSPGSFHVVGLGVRSFDEAADEVAASPHCSTHYAAEMREMGRFILRTQPKLRQSDGSVYRDEPEPVAVVGGEGPVSSPHAIRLMQLAADTGRSDVAVALDELVEAVGAVGATFSTSKYETLTDELRAAVHGGKADE